jgi:transposase
MLSFPSSRRIWLARSTTDMRRGIDTLVSMVVGELGGEPRGGDCFVFVGRDQRRLKVLVWDAGGYWLCGKRLERGTFAIPVDAVGPDKPGAAPLSTAELHLLLEGINVHHATYHAHYHRPPETTP